MKCDVLQAAGRDGLIPWRDAPPFILNAHLIAVCPVAKVVHF